MLIKYYINSIFYPAVLTLFLYMVISVIQMQYGPEYKSEWMTAGAFFFVAIVTVILHAMFIAVMALPLFLNQIEQVRNNIILSTLTWFSAPIIWCSGMIVTAVNFLYTNDYPLYDYFMNGDRIFLAGSILPYLTGLYLTFKQFRKNKALNPGSGNRL